MYTHAIIIHRPLTIKQMEIHIFNKKKLRTRSNICNI